MTGKDRERLEAIGRSPALAEAADVYFLLRLVEDLERVLSDKVAESEAYQRGYCEGLVAQGGPADERFWDLFVRQFTPAIRWALEAASITSFKALTALKLKDLPKIDGIGPYRAGIIWQATYRQGLRFFPEVKT